jgi:DNA-directed RNA polymerase specialized sigma subunit
MSGEHLTGRGAQVIRLYVEEDLKIWEIAARLGLSQSAVSRILDTFRVRQARSDYLRDRDEEIIRSYEQGLPPEEIAAEYGVSASGVAEIVGRAGAGVRWAGVAGRKKGAPLEPAEYRRWRKQEIARLYLERRWTLKEIGKHFGLSHVAVINVLEGGGIRRRTRGWRSGWPWKDRNELSEEVIGLYVEEGLTVKQVGGRLGLSGACVGRVLMREGVDRRHPGWYRRQRLAQRNREIVRLCLQEGLKRKDVAARFDLRPETISGILAKEKLRRGQARPS